MSNQCVHSGRQSTPKKALRRLGATVGTLGLAIAGAAATALPAQATDPACPVGVCTVNGNETVVHGTWTVNGPLVLAADETLRVASSGNIELEDGASISGDGKIVNEWNLYVFGSDVVISVPVENRKDGGGADGALTVSTGAGVTFKNVSLDNGGGVYSGGFIAFEGGSEPGQASNLINSGRVDNYGSMLFESGSDTGVTSKLVNEGDVFNGNGYMYFLKAEVEGSGTFDGTDEHAPLYSAFFASSVFEHQDDEGEIVAACAPTLTPDGGTIPPWANSETVDGVTVAFFYEGYAFDLLAPTSCSLEGQARPFLGWGQVTGRLENAVGTLIELNPLTPAFDSCTMPAGSAVFIAAYGSLEPLPVPPAKPTLPATGTSSAAVVEPMLGAASSFAIGVYCFALVARRRRVRIANRL